MKLNTALNDPIFALNYAEQKINKGSLSNFTGKFTTSPETNPESSEHFNISAIKLECYPESLIDYGVLPAFCFPPVMYIHPDLKSFFGDLQIYDTDEYVIPTSSSRTVKLENKPYYLKLCYPGRIGRITRELDQRHILSSVEVNRIFEKIINESDAPAQFAFMPEYGGRLFSSVSYKIGFVIRDYTPVGKNVSKVRVVLPGFSLFSKDNENNEDNYLLHQILITKDKPITYVLEQCCYPLVDIFFYCVMKGGIVPEMHSQNILFGFDENWNIKSIILRDLESHDKDITIMKQLGLNVDMLCSYKCIEESQYNYRIKHSFMFDHKLGEYLIEEILKIAAIICSVDVKSLRQSIKNYVRSKYGKFIEKEEFFPNDGKWYKFKNVVIDRTKIERPYISIDNPLFR